MKKSSSSDSSKLDRKTVERNRRIHMKGLCFKLASLIPPHHNKSKEQLSQQDQIDQAAAYITQLKERVEGLKMRKELINRKNGNQHHLSNGYSASTMTGGMYPLNSSTLVPVVDLREWDSGLELSLISGVKKNFMLYEVITILEEEGAEVVSASISKVGDKVFHSIHAQVRISRVGVETSRVCERLQDLIYSL